MIGRVGEAADLDRAEAAANGRPVQRVPADGLRALAPHLRSEARPWADLQKSIIAAMRSGSQTR